MRPIAVLLPAALALAACAAPVSRAQTPAQPPAGPAPVGPGQPRAALLDPDAARRAAETITPSDLYARVEFLAHDRMRGRNTPSPELDLAAAYLVSEYRAWGAQPAGENGTFYQWWPYPMRRLGVDGARLEVRGPAGAARLAHGRDFFSAGGTEAAFVGPVSYAPRGAEGALAEGSLAGRLLVMPLPGRFDRDFRAERSRQRDAARRAGAVAVVHVLDASWTADSIAKYARAAGQGTRTLGGDVAYPQFLVSAGAGARLLAAGGADAAERETPGGGASGGVVPLTGVTATAALPMEHVDQARAPNVVAMIPGSDPVLRNEYVVLSAHLDHVGVGQPVNGDSIYNGADDDASGNAALLEVAEAIASLPRAPRRTIVFLHVSGEEKGLLGSEWYSEHPTLPLDRIVANINVDMIARNSLDSVVVIGKDYSSLGAVVDAVQGRHPELRLTASDDLWPEERFFFRSDHFNFARKEVPAIFFFSGVHADYHRPSDEVERLDVDKGARIARFIFWTLLDIANADARPAWDPEGLAEVRRLTR